MAKEAEKTAPAKPAKLENDSLVRLKRPFRVGLETYPPSRFGVVIPAGTVLPRDAIVLKKVEPEPAVEEISAEELAKQQAEAEAKADADAKAKLKV